MRQSLRSLAAMRSRFHVPENLFKPRRDFEIAEKITAAEISRSERALGIKLPSAFIELLKIRNGGSLRLTRFVMPSKPPAKFQSLRGRNYHVSSLAGLHKTHRSALTQLTAAARDNGLEAGLFPLDGDGHYWMCLDYRKSGSRRAPTITHWEQDEPKNHMCPVAGSFETLVRGLRRAPDDFEPAAIALDHASVRGERLRRLLKSLGCTKQRKIGSIARSRIPETWHWPKYKSYVRGNPGWLTIEKNKTYGFAPKFDQRPVGHFLLCVRVTPAQADRCLSELMGALGSSAVLLQGVV